MRHHILVYLGVTAALLAVSLDLSQIAAVGIVFYLIMDIVIHWGVLRRLRSEVDPKPGIIIAAIAADAVVLLAFTVLRGMESPWMIAGAYGAAAAVFAYEAWYLRRHPERDSNGSGEHESSSAESDAD
ncbi:hypothetical protein [Demequina sp. NBRC 110053]|uniref:hypothetical protein n=1 Tax=Demequina sp. NBRC 110053 TaxID=1570342 RepID=UPI00190EBFD7|nr:hypothetical protein [Demequina sp. NBRC 110053]